MLSTFSQPRLASSPACELVYPLAASSAAVMPFCAARPGWKLFVMLPNISRRPTGWLAAMPSAQAMRCASSPSSLADGRRRAEDAGAAGDVPADIVMLGNTALPMRHSTSMPSTSALMKSGPDMGWCWAKASSALATGPAGWMTYADACRRNRRRARLMPLSRLAFSGSSFSGRPRTEAERGPEKGERAASAASTAACRQPPTAQASQLTKVRAASWRTGAGSTSGLAATRWRAKARVTDGGAAVETFVGA